MHKLSMTKERTLMGKFGFKENPVVHLDLDFDLGFVKNLPAGRNLTIMKLHVTEDCLKAGLNSFKTKTTCRQTHWWKIILWYNNSLKICLHSQSCLHWNSEWKSQVFNTLNLIYAFGHLPADSHQWKKLPKVGFKD